MCRFKVGFIVSGDNLSMEVRFSEGSSHHASDISSVSYQNLLDDDTTTADLSRRGSEDSVDSYLHEYSDDIPRTGDITLPSQDSRSYSDKINERISVQLTEEDICLKKEDYEFMKSSQSVKSDPGPDVKDKDYQLKYVKSSSMNPPISVHESFRKHELVVTMRDQGRSKSLPPSEGEKPVEKKRNSLEIRNNIPVAGEVKNYEKDIHIDSVTFNSHGAMPKIRKQSPGLACRVEEKQNNANKISNTENPPLKMDSNATQIINDLIQVSKANAAAINAASKRTNVKDESEESPSAITQNGLGVTQPPADILNEYEYVKYSRIQEGNSYVGMRLAYSSSESDSQCQRSVEGVDDLRETTRVELTDVDGYNRQLSPESNSLQNCINEDTLTEIPLNGPENVVVGDESKLFTLSPENTECDSVEIESVVSDGDNEAVGMPNVEDGLSSSQTSDTEDVVKSEHNTPKKILQQKQQEEIEKKLYGVECATMKPKEMDAEAIMDDLKMKREALDHAISEIKSAIQKSKGVTVEAPPPVSEEDPVWVKR